MFGLLRMLMLIFLRVVIELSEWEGLVWLGLVLKYCFGCSSGCVAL